MIENIRELLLTPAEMAAVDLAAAASGIDSFALMERAGAAVASAALRFYPEAGRVAVLCGPGNNGGDGYVAARHLVMTGATVEVFHWGNPSRLAGDAARARDTYASLTSPLDNYMPKPGDLIIDALFGAGLTRDLPAEVRDAFQRAKDANTPVLAVDLPSGLDGRTGEVLGECLRADHTITFMTRKPGHLLMPGRELCGTLEIFDIGIPARIVRAETEGGIAENRPERWRHLTPSSSLETHKYRRGHLVVFSGGASKTGAARMSATAGLKAGAGLVTIASSAEAMDANAAHLTAIMLHPVEDEEALREWLEDQRLQTFVLGPGFGIGAKARAFAAVLCERRLVLDADGISSFSDEPGKLFDLFENGEPRLVLTPHEGEFGRLFPDIAADRTLGKVGRAQAAASRSNAAIVYKGADTVIAAPDGRAYINTNAPPWLATAGSGDVLAGIIGALMAQGMPTFEAAAAGVYLHGEAGLRAGKGLTAEELAAHVLPL
ncbi:bifunctional ADP-dependent NAD(P)H-hydrate dehydratase/NAD(P)H-hydrate epimerase [Rhizobium sp. Root1220]|uniref:bifunctional ADP-dependent NAD(P)H-hydrate dehydratase/NAD(P)H-hydrate epimerase n=1 Tax=Rhizobium sp. Root1220 TaxID=1736432 RepID=UPI0006F57156|nr:bifunctional ADP-dependent NAD(P)H-hydrate dehydratase/NAD(P)H-hydrate epimerase [Rhizobium sp. Root1220]KQV81500.1 NAD(P)H-hydrate epimerase [Rhizobium sp. Root1220]